MFSIVFTVRVVLVFVKFLLSLLPISPFTSVMLLTSILYSYFIFSTTSLLITHYIFITLVKVAYLIAK